MADVGLRGHPGGRVSGGQVLHRGDCPFVQALKSFRHPYCDVTAPALALYALGDQWQEPEATWRVGCRDRFAAQTADAQVIELRASHYLFIDRRDDVLAAMRVRLT